MAKYQYRDRGDESREKRANQSSGAFDHYLKDEYRLFTPAKGENCVRILPPSRLWEDAPHYGLDVFVHFGIGPDKGSVICLDKGAPQLPGMSGHPCPICQERARAERARDEETARELRPVKRVITAVLDRKDEAKGVLIWGMPFTVDQQITKASRNRQQGGWFLIDRPDDGYDIYFSRVGEGLVTKYEAFERAQNSSRVSDRYMDWIDDNPIPEMLKWRDYDEVQRLFEGRSRGEDPDEVERPTRDDDRPPPWRGDRDERRDREDRNERRAREQRSPRDEGRGRREEETRDTRDERRQERMRERDPERARDDRDDESLRKDAEHLDRVTRGKMTDDYDRGEARRRQEQEDEDRPPPSRERAVRRPTAAANGNGSEREAEPPPATKPSGKSRAEDLRSQFLSRR